MKHSNGWKFALAAILLASAGSALSRNEEPVALTWSNGVTVTVDEGRGEPASIGSYSVRLYGDDGLLDFLDGLVRTRDGAVEKCWLRDFDQDGKPELAVWIRNAGSGDYGTLDLYRIEGKKLQRIETPELPARKEKSYHGHDQFDVQDGDLVCSFPIYLGDEPENDPKGGREKYVLDLKKGQWTEF